MNNQDLIALSIYKTKDYDKFSIDDKYNRDVNENIVKKIKASIKDCGDKGHVFPIVVDDKFRIIDGQHRFKSRKEMGLSIYYIQDIELDSESLGIINDAVGKWKVGDFEKITKEKEIVKAMRAFQKDLPKEITMSIIGKWIGVNNKKMITSSDIKTEEAKAILNQIKPYINFLLKALDYHNLSSTIGGNKAKDEKTLRVFLLGTVVKKLAKKRVLIANLPLNYTFNDFVEYLVKNKII